MKGINYIMEILLKLKGNKEDFFLFFKVVII